MPNCKFKIGDKVRITGSRDDATDHLDGKIGTVVFITPSDLSVTVGDDPIPWFIWKHNAKLVNRIPKDKIVITHDGKTTTAALCREDGTKKTATANCAPEDEFDFATGAELALKRLFGKEDVGMNKPEKPKYYSGKVVCVASDFSYDFTAGKIYTFVDGVVKDNRGASRYVGHPISDPTEIKSVWKFIPLVE